MTPWSGKLIFTHFLAKTAISYKENSLFPYLSKSTVVTEFKLSSNVNQMIIYNFSIDTMLGKSRFIDLTAFNNAKKSVFSNFLDLHTYQLNSSLTFQLTSSPTFQLTYSPTQLLSNSPTHLLSCSLTHLLTYSPTFSTIGGSTSSSLV